MSSSSYLLQSGTTKFAPGYMSPRLLEALGMEHSQQKEGDGSSAAAATGAATSAATVGAPQVPTPWLFNMQRYGPPPCYPRQKIPGLTGPIPVGAEFGYHPGGWGKPPVDENGKPLYGDDVFNQNGQMKDIDRWYVVVVVFILFLFSEFTNKLWLFFLHTCMLT